MFALDHPRVFSLSESIRRSRLEFWMTSGHVFFFADPNFEE